jgi:hypothetical protein
MRCYASACYQAGKLDQSEHLLRESLEHCLKRDDSVRRRIEAAVIRGSLARTLQRQGRYQAAESLVREALMFFEKERPDDLRRFFWVNLLGAVLADQQRYAEAEPLLLQGFEGVKEREAILAGKAANTQIAECGERIVRFYEMTGQQEKATAWRAKLPAVRGGPWP